MKTMSFVEVCKDMIEACPINCSNEEKESLKHYYKKSMTTLIAIATWLSYEVSCVDADEYIDGLWCEL